MSRVGKMPITIPQGVEVSVSGGADQRQGQLGTLVRPVNALVTVKNEAGMLSFAPANDSVGRQRHERHDACAGGQHGQRRDQGFREEADPGRRGLPCAGAGQKLNLQIGFSHPVVKEMPAGVKVETPTQTEIVIKGVDRQAVGQVAAEVRAMRPPEPYKGKGIRYADERVTPERDEEEVRSDTTC